MPEITLSMLWALGGIVALVLVVGQMIVRQQARYAQLRALYRQEQAAREDFENTLLQIACVAPSQRLHVLILHHQELYRLHGNNTLTPWTKEEMLLRKRSAFKESFLNGNNANV